MSDDLVKRLREGDHFEKVMSAEQAADRIEELELECETWKSRAIHQNEVGAELEAKLAKVVEERDALTGALVEAMIVPEAWMMSGFPEMSNEAREQIIASVTNARATLAELTGGKDDT